MLLCGHEEGKTGKLANERLELVEYAPLGLHQIIASLRRWCRH
jgi:hypothetical protein